MRSPLAAATLALIAVVPAWAAGPTVRFALPIENATPAAFGSLPWPNDLYFDQGRPGDGDGTLLAAGASIGLAADVIQANTATIEDALDRLDGFGTTTAVYFFLSAPIDPATLPASPGTAPSLGDSVFCADAVTGTPVPIALRWDLDTRIPNVLGILPLPGKPLAAKTTYACVVTTAVTDTLAQPVEASADWQGVRDGASANGDADAIVDPVVTMLGTQGVAAADVAGMTVFTTQSTVDDVVEIRQAVLPGLPLPTADFTSRPELVFDTDAKLAALLGATPHDHVRAIATGFYGSPRFQTHDPDGDGALADLPLPPSFVTCAVPCETTDERFTRDGSGTPIVIDTPQIPFTVVIPKGTPPPWGWPVIIQQHGLGGQRDTVVGFGEPDAARGFASIGIDAAAHGYRFFDCTPAAPCSQDTANTVGGTAVPDGFADGSLAGLSVSFITVQLGFFQGFHNILGIRDNFRQTYVDLMSLVRLMHGHSIDAALGTTLNDSQIFYMGHSLGGLVGSGLAPIEPDVLAFLLNATGGGLTSQLFINSSIGAGAQGLVTAILGLDPANVPDQFNFATNFTQTVIDPADGLNAAGLLFAPVLGAPRNVIQVEDFGDEVSPNQSNEALAVASGLQLFDPFVQNLHQSAFTLPVTSTVGTIHGNAAGGATAALLQNGPATHAASLGTAPGTLTFVPEFGHFDEYAPPANNGFPLLERGIRVPNAGILDEVLDWFADIVANGPPGTFSFGGAPNFNPIQNADVPAGPSTHAFLARTVNAGGTTPFSEPTPDVTVAFTSNVVASRVTAGRSILGSTAQASDGEVPPGPASTIGTLGFLPFFVTLQRGIPGLFAADLTFAYTTTELAIAGITPGSTQEAGLVIARFDTGTCMLGAAVCSENGDCGANGPCIGAGYTPLPTTVDTTLHTVTTNAVTSFSTFAVLHPDALAAGFRPPLVPGGGKVATDCRAEWQVVNATNTPFLDKRGFLNRVQECQDGDAACDADRTADGTCTFRVGVCLDQTDPNLQTCSAGGTTGYQVRKPKPTAKDPVDAANGAALVNVLTALGGTVTGARQNVVHFTTPLAAPTCTGFTPIEVPLRKSRPTTKTVRGCAELGKCVDADRLKLRCLPAG